MQRFSDIVDAADKLSTDEQLALFEILRNRLAAQERLELVKDVKSGRSEFENGGLKSKSIGSIMDEIGNES